jgi:carbamoyl-phosphate synthase large subunit
MADQIITKSKNPWNVLVFPGGTEVGLEINKSLRGCKEIRLFSAASDVPNHAPFFYKNHFIIPDIYKKECIIELIGLIERLKIDFLFPANPIIMDFLDSNRHLIPCIMIMPDSEIFNLLRSKSKTYAFLSDVIPVPKLYKDSAVLEYPVYLKPDRMYGAQGGRRIGSKLELDAVGVGREEIICEYLPGEEYTIDCFSSHEKALLYSGPRTRERVRMGTSMRSRPVSSDIEAELKRYAYALNKVLGISGPWFFQMKRASDGRLKLLEVDPRVAGTMALSRVRGVNIPLLSLYEFAGIPFEIYPTEIEDLLIDRALINRYYHDIKYKTVYIDLDDTIINKGKLDTDIIKFLYQCVNDGKKIILISKSLEKDKNALLARYRIRELFDEIIWIEEQDSKKEYMRDSNAIYIDDSFSQRREVSLHCGIPTFDSSMIELLMSDQGV